MLLSVVRIFLTAVQLNVEMESSVFNSFYPRNQTCYLRLIFIQYFSVPMGVSAKTIARRILVSPFLCERGLALADPRVGRQGCPFWFQFFALPCSLG